MVLPASPMGRRTLRAFALGTTGETTAECCCCIDQLRFAGEGTGRAQRNIRLDYARIVAVPSDHCNRMQ
jgi:hypothetical protein